MATKERLRAARAALAAKDCDGAVAIASAVLDDDPACYPALVLRAAARSSNALAPSSSSSDPSIINHDDFVAARNDLEAAVAIAPDAAPAHLGLLRLHEAAANHIAAAAAAAALADIHLAAKDAPKARDAISKQAAFYALVPDRINAINALRQLLPGSPLADIDPDIIPPPAQTLSEIASLRETHDALLIEKEIELRRMRLGADPLPILRANVEREVALSSDIVSIYDQILDLPSESDSDLAHSNSIRCKLLGLLIRRLPIIPDSQRHSTRDRIDQLAHFLVDNDIHSPIAFETLIEAQNAPILDRDATIISRASELFTSDDLAIAKFARAFVQWLASTNSLPPHISSPTNNYAAAQIAQDIVSGLNLAPNSVFGYHLLTRIYMETREWALAAAAAVKCRSLATTQEQSSGLTLGRVITDAELMLGTALTEQGHASAPRAITIYRAILQDDNSNIAALHGLGLALVAIGRLEEASRCLKKIIALDPENHDAIVDDAWICFLQGNHNDALQAMLSAQERNATHLVKYRLARIYWAMDESYRRDKSFVHTLLIDAAKLNPLYHPTFTLLGKYYETIETDMTRATKCYLKVLSIDRINDEATQSLCMLWIRTKQTDRALPLLRDAVVALPRASWAWKYLGILTLRHLGRADEATTYLQSAVRIDSKDPVTWSTLGEAYAHEGKYTAAVKALDHAIDMDSSALFPRYMRATVHHRLGLFSDAVIGFRHCFDNKSDDDGDDSALSRASVPVLKGLADTLLSYARSLHDDGAYGACAARLLDAINTSALGMSIDPSLVCLAKTFGDACIALVVLVPDLIDKKHGLAVDDAVAKIEPVSCTSIGPFEDTAWKSTSRSKNIHGSEAMHRVLYGACWAYRQSLSLMLENSHGVTMISAYAHDLSIAYYHAYKCMRRQPSVSSTQHCPPIDPLLGIAIKWIHVAIRISPSSATSWSALGVMIAETNPRYSQHALIRATQLAPQSPSYWCNLGVFYLLRDEVDLAAQCFSRAQLVDPDWPMVWFGQAHVVRLGGARTTTLAGNGSNDGGMNTPLTLGTTNLFNLFEHAHELSGARHYDILYAHAVSCFTHLHQSPSALTTAAHCLLKCMERRPNDPAAANLYGLTLERLGQYDKAIDAFTTSAQMLGATHTNGDTHHPHVSAETDTQRVNHLAAVLENKARCECANGQFDISVATFGEATALGCGDAYTFVGQGIASYFAGALEDSLKAFEQALAVCDTSESETNGSTTTSSHLNRLRNDTTLMLSQVLYALGTSHHIDLAKQQLLHCIQRDAQYVPAIVSLTALGLVLSDWTLAQSGASELLALTPETMESQSHNVDTDAIVDDVLCALFALQGRSSSATSRRFLSKAVHRRPWRAVRWTRLAMHTLAWDWSPKLSRGVVSVARSGYRIHACAKPDSIAGGVRTGDVAGMLRGIGLAVVADGGSIETGNFGQRNNGSGDAGLGAGLVKRRRSAMDVSRSALCAAVRASPGVASHWVALAVHQSASWSTSRNKHVATVDDVGDANTTFVSDATTAEIRQAASLDRIADAAIAIATSRVNDADNHQQHITEWAKLFKSEAMLRHGHAVNDMNVLSSAIQIADNVAGVAAAAATATDTEKCRVDVSAALRQAALTILGRALGLAGHVSTSIDAFRAAVYGIPSLSGHDTMMERYRCGRPVSWTTPLEQLERVYTTASDLASAAICRRVVFAVMDAEYGSVHRNDTRQVTNTTNDGDDTVMTPATTPVVHQRLKIPILVRAAVSAIQAGDTTTTAMDLINDALRLNPHDAPARFIQTLLMVVTARSTDSSLTTQQRSKIGKQLVWLRDRCCGDDGGDSDVDPVLIDWIETMVQDK